jgi:YD repeat-containing protein
MAALTSLEDPDGNTTTYVYDGLNHVKSDTNQLNYTRSYVYDLDGNLLQETDRDGRVRNFTYDHLNRRTSEQWKDGSTVLETFSYSYNADGQLTSAAAPDSAYAYSYDGEGRTEIFERVRIVEFAGVDQAHV